MTTDAPPPPPTPSDDPAGPPADAPPAAPRSAEAQPPAPSRLSSGLAALGVALLAAGVAVSAAYSRLEGDLDATVYGTGLAATVALLVLAAGARVLDRIERGSDLAAWAGAVGVVAATVMVGVGIAEDLPEDAAGYLLGGLLAGLSALGYVVTRRGSFVVTAIVGLAMAYANGFVDVLPDLADQDHPAALAALGVVVFVAAVSLLGWALPTRALSAQVVGWMGVLGLVSLAAGLAVMQAIEGFFADMFAGFGGALFGGGPAGDFGSFGDLDAMSDEEFEDLFGDLDGMSDEELDELFGGVDPFSGSDPFAVPPVEGHGLFGGMPDLTTDVWVVLAAALGLVLAWAATAAITRRAGFAVLAGAMAVGTVPLGTFALAIERPTAWVAVLAGVGVVVLALALLRTAKRRT